MAGGRRYSVAIEDDVVLVRDDGGSMEAAATISLPLREWDRIVKLVDTMRVETKEG